MGYIAHYKGNPILGPQGPSGPDGNPIGTVISFLGLTAPEGYLVCDGAEYEITAYPALADFFLQQFGSKNYFGGDGTASFAVPDMRNLFLRGYHGEAEEQLSGEVGARQEATKHPAFSTGTNGNNDSYFWASYTKQALTLEDTVVIPNSDTQHVIPGSYSWGYTTPTARTNVHVMPNTYTSRPVNMAVLYCVKAV